MTSGPRTCHLGIDIGTESVRSLLFDALDGEPLGEAVEPLVLRRGRGRAELDFNAAWSGVDATLVRLDREAAGRLSITNVGVSTRASTICALDEELRPRGNGLLWTDNRASVDAEAIRATNHPVLARMLGQVSPEWGLAKLAYLWRTSWSGKTAGRRGTSVIRHVVEMLDWVNLQLTGRLVGNAGIREWGWCVDELGEWPADLVARLDLAEPLALLPEEALRTGDLVGSISPGLSARYPMLAGASVVMGGMDSYLAALGQGVGRHARMTASFGSSSSLVAPTSVGDGRGRLFGPLSRILPAGSYWHGGQSTAGLSVDWIVQLLGRDRVALETSARSVPPGSAGVAFRETLLGRHPPDPEPGMRAVWNGLTLSHTAGHLFRSVLEGVALGARRAAGRLQPDELVITGAMAESSLFREILASAFARPVGRLRHAQAAAFGAAFAHESDRIPELNQVIEWVEPGRPIPARAMDRYLALHRLSPSIGGDGRGELQSA
jgi:sugar (pentulose or hexulose) kinase